MGRKQEIRQQRRQSRRNLRQAPVIGFEYDAAAGVSRIGMERQRDRTPISARNEAQAHYILTVQSKPLTFAHGDAGCGKTWLATALAAEALLAKEVEQIIVTRPVLSADEDLGFLPGDVKDKFMPYFKPVYDVLRERLGSSFLEYCLKPEIGKIEIAPFAYMRGTTFKNAFVILDEAQNVTVNQMKLFLTRVGDNCRVVVNGDVTQCDLPGNVPSGLNDALKRFAGIDRVGLIEFLKEDSVRSEICSLALQAY